MKHASTLKPQKAYITRRADYDNSLWTQEEAERLALIDGNPEEAKRRRDAATDLRSKKRRGEIKPIDMGLVRLLGPRHPVSLLMKSRYLEDRHGSTAYCLMIYEQPAPKSPNLERVEQSGVSGLESIVDIRLRLARAKKVAEATLPSEKFKKPVSGLVCGSMTVLQAGRCINGNKERGPKLVKEALRKYLEAAEPHFVRVT
jgi:hypothetical protein